eukprot:825762-Pyramimonas_sp.AAC.1
MSGQPFADFMIGGATRVFGAATNIIAALRGHTGDAQGVAPGECGAHSGHQVPASDPAGDHVDVGMDHHVAFIQVNGGAATVLRGAKAIEKRRCDLLGAWAALNWDRVAVRSISCLLDVDGARGISCACNLPAQQADFQFHVASSSGPL